MESVIKKIEQYLSEHGGSHGNGILRGKKKTKRPGYGRSAFAILCAAAMTMTTVAADLPAQAAVNRTSSYEGDAANATYNENTGAAEGEGNASEAAGSIDADTEYGTDSDDASGDVSGNTSGENTGSGESVSEDSSASGQDDSGQSADDAAQDQSEQSAEEATSEEETEEAVSYASGTLTYGTDAFSRKCRTPDPTGTINAALSGLLRWYGYLIRKEKELQTRETIRKEALQKAERFLNACYGELRESGSSALPGEPWESGSSPLPGELMGKTSEYTSICSRKGRDYGKDYVIEIDGYEGVQNRFLNVEDDLFQSSLDRQIAEEGKCIIGFDAGRFGFPEKGIYTDACLCVDPAVFASEDDVCPARDTIWESRTGCITHMAVLVSRRKYKDGKIYYLAADSGSSAERHGGYWALEYNWMRKYVMQAVVHKKYLQKRIDFQRIERQREMPWTFF